MDQNENILNNKKMKMAPVLRVLGLLTIGMSVVVIFTSADRVSAVYVGFVASIAAASFFAGAEVLTCLHSLVENTSPKNVVGPVPPVPVPTVQDLNEAVRAMEEARRP